MVERRVWRFGLFGRQKYLDIAKPKMLASPICQIRRISTTWDGSSLRRIAPVRRGSVSLLSWTSWAICVPSGMHLVARLLLPGMICVSGGLTTLHSTPDQSGTLSMAQARLVCRGMRVGSGLASSTTSCGGGRNPGGKTRAQMSRCLPATSRTVSSMGRAAPATRLRHII